VTIHEVRTRASNPARENAEPVAFSERTYSENLSTYRTMTNTVGKMLLFIVRDELGMRPGGFGIAMVRAIADELLYNEAQNEVVLIKYLTGTMQNYAETISAAGKPENRNDNADGLILIQFAAEGFGGENG
jgi:hypothetical protein